MILNSITNGDSLAVLKTLPDESVDCIITSPPYWGLRDYGVAGQLGSEKTIGNFLSSMLRITLELKRVLKQKGTMFWNHGDNYGTGSGAGSRAGSKQTQRHAMPKAVATVKGYEKSLMLQAYRLAIRMVDEQGWILRNQIIWHKPNAMPSSVKDRFGVDFEPVFFFTKSKKYWFEKQLEDSTDRKYKPFNLRVRDAEKLKSSQYKASSAEKIKYAEKNRMAGGGQGLHAHSGNYSPDGTYIGTPGKRNMRTVWRIPSHPFKDAHFATFPEALIEPMVLAGCPRGGGMSRPIHGRGDHRSGGKETRQKLPRNRTQFGIHQDSGKANQHYELSLAV